MTAFVTTTPGLRPKEAVGGDHLAGWDRLLFAIAGFGLLLFLANRLPSLAAALDIQLANGDDSMRLVGIRDLLAGQSWFDTTQYRYLPPNGASMHWSRLLDAPLALAIWLLTPIVGQRAAEAIVVTAWPPLLFTAYAGVLFVGLRRVFGLAAAALAIPVAAQLMLFGDLFGTGRIDHHNVQVILVLAACLCWAAGERRPMAAAWSGGLAGLSLAIGLETLPFVACLGCVAFLSWAFGAPGAETPPSVALRRFGPALALASVAAFGLQTDPAAWFAPACDTLARPWLILTCGAGLTGLLTRLPVLATWPRRLGAGAFAGAAIVAVFAAVDPACLGGPYGGVPEPYRAAWLDAIAEAYSLPEMYQARRVETFMFYGPVIAAAVAASFAVKMTAGEGRRLMIVTACLLWTGVALSLAQMRALYAPTGLAAIAGGWALAHLLAGVTARREMRPTLMAGAAALMFFEPFWLLIGVTAPEAGRPERTALFPGASCRTADVRALAALPTGTALAPIDLGPPILLNTGHSIIAGGFHRASESIVAGIDAFTGSEEDMRRAARRHGADYIVICPGWLVAEEGREPPFAAALARGASVDWLKPLPERGALKAFRVLPKAGG